MNPAILFTFAPIYDILELLGKFDEVFFLEICQSVKQSGLNIDVTSVYLQFDIFMGEKTWDLLKTLFSRPQSLS